MQNENLRRIFSGVNDDGLLFALYHHIRKPSNEAQRTFCSAWGATEMLNGDGFEFLIEQGKPLEDYSEAFVRVGMPQVKPIFDRVAALFPPELFSPDKETELFELLSGLFEELKKLLYEFFDVSKDVVPTISSYVRAHREDFMEHAEATMASRNP